MYCLWRKSLCKSLFNRFIAVKTIEIPPNFSNDLTSLVSKDVKKADIIYTVNEKINAIFAMVFDNELGTESETIGEGN